MMSRRLLALIVPLSAAFGLSACSDYGYGYGGRGYSRVSVGIGYGNRYYDPYYDYYGSNPYWGWYNGYYYPGTGIYVYDRYRRPFSWAPYSGYWTQRRNYWQGRPDWRSRGWDFRDNWRDFDRRRDGRRYRRR